MVDKNSIEATDDKLINLFAEAFADATKNSCETGPILLKCQRPNENDYGYSESNPICSSTLAGTDIYLGKLRTSDGKNFTWQRVGDVRVDCHGVTNVGMDKYQLYLDGKPYKVLYIIPYVAEATKPPYGLKIFDESVEISSEVFNTTNTSNEIKQVSSNEKTSYVDNSSQMDNISCKKPFFQKNKNKKTINKEKRTIIFLSVACVILVIALFCTSLINFTKNDNSKEGITSVTSATKKDADTLIDWLLKNGTLIDNASLVYETTDNNGDTYRLVHSTNYTSKLVVIYTQKIEDYTIVTRVPLDVIAETKGKVDFWCEISDKEGDNLTIRYQHTPYKFTSKTPITTLEGYSENKMFEVANKCSHENLCKTLDWLKNEICPLAKFTMIDLGYCKYK